ncbi:MAG TPA: hypothetical protein VED87_06585 [Methylocystis sp.]|nr:hypothetical protein [Methylocystis sp.]
MRASIWLLPLLLVGAPATAQATALTTDDQIRQAIVGNTMAGEDEGESFSEYYNPDGRILGERRAGRYTGHWHIAGAQMCVRYADDDGKESVWECSRIDVDGNKVTWSDEEDKAIFTLTPGNPGKF